MIHFLAIVMKNISTLIASPLLLAVIFTSATQDLPNLPVNGQSQEEARLIPRQGIKTQVVQDDPPEVTIRLLPDVRTQVPYDLRLVVDRDRKHIRFSNAIYNSGIGPVELRGEFDRTAGNMEVIQVIYKNDGSHENHPMGEFQYHQAHDHWHWDGFALYEIWTVTHDGRLGEAVASSGKVGYCIRDDTRLDHETIEAIISPDVDVPSRGGYQRCNWRIQGLSVGWNDVYAHNTPGQHVDVSHLPEGVYALKSTANPKGLLIELTTINNSEIAFFQLETNRVRVIDRATLFSTRVSGAFHNKISYK
jgi:hypothetical protein